MTALKPPRGLSHAPRRALLLASAAFLCLFLLPAVVARADSASTLTIVGTSDVSDSGLMANLIQPMFTAAYPQFTFKYIGSATGTAINNAETGNNGPSVLIVHAASLENQFVGNGYSYEQYGRALFTNDFVLGGPTADPAGVGANGASNIVQAFADLAAAGDNGGGTPKITFVSRGGTPGTTVQEHQIWALVASSGLAPASLNLCQVSAAAGGGLTPVTAASRLNGLPCGGTGGLPPSSALPPWYVATGLTQGPNVVFANNCTGFPSGPNTCYVFTDRGTFDYAASGTDPAGTIPNLKIVTRGPQNAAAPGGPYLLTNYFHGYIINPSAPCGCETVNLTAAQAFINFLTSPAFQAQLKTYLATSDPAGPPFVADASPIITAAAGFPATDTAGTPVTVTGTVTNAEPGYPALAGKTVNVDEVIGGVGVHVSTATTSASGSYSISFVPPASGSYEVSTNQIAQIENSKLSPVFGDLLSPASTAPASITVQPKVTPKHKVSFKKITVKKGKVTVSGTLKPAPTASGAKVFLLALRTKTLKGGKKKTVLARVAAIRLKQLAKTSVGKGKTTFKIKTKLERGYRWTLQLEYVQKGQTSTFSKRRSVAVR